MSLQFSALAAMHDVPICIRYLRNEVFIESGMKENTRQILLALPLARQLRFVPVCWRQVACNTYQGRFSSYLTSCLVADIAAVADL